MATREQPTASLTQRLADAVSDELIKHERAIEGTSGSPRSLHVELVLTRDGRLRDSSFYVEHHLTPNELIGLGGTRERRR